MEGLTYVHSGEIYEYYAGDCQKTVPKRQVQSNNSYNTFHRVYAFAIVRLYLNVTNGFPGMPGASGSVLTDSLSDVSFSKASSTAFDDELLLPEKGRCAAASLHP